MKSKLAVALDFENHQLAEKLMEELKPGTRIVSHAFDMGDWEPELKLNVGGRIVYLWTIP